MKKAHITTTGHKIELKAIKHSAHGAYTANLYVNGKVFVLVANSGDGSSATCYKHPKNVIDNTVYRTVLAEVNKGLDGKDILNGNIENWCAKEVTKYLAK